MAAKRLPLYKRVGNVVSARGYLTTEQFAKLMGMSQRYARRLAEQGKIPSERQGRNWIITYEMGMTSETLAVQLGLSHSYTRHLLSEGIIAGGVKVGRNWIYPYYRRPEDIYRRKRRQKGETGEVTKKRRLRKRHQD